MVDFDTGRTLGLVGSILVLVALIFSFIIGFLGFLLQLVGLILILISLHTFSNIYGERIIFRDALLSVLIGYGVPLAALAALIFLFILLIPIGFTIVTSARPIPPSRIEDFFGAQITASIILWAFIAILAILVALAISAYLWYRALNTLSLRSGEKFFRWAGLTYLAFAVSLIVGVVTAVILIGILVIFIGILLGLTSWVLLAIAFYEIKPPQPPIQAPSAPVVQV
jgi:uncharacterized membrane protein